ncbi:glyoxylase-like metal-dependent hydrolase (beta-lactamase superfamily II) [Brevibacterium sanguinis]|uniref:Glyoxylase-like metal-dependent hydrolase (Beta-lactamase superfamily II) n=2 Tax=Brevibacterium TaxID=1696 RepID=A0A366ICS7_9MICO|nr:MULTISPECIES: MBL fold metallo-hydrolase [Brevibacterium]RBP62354.1 glyoxylase-like metal-dependent hydrolase (beta-lactamase superfamily II) [Brevibacterium sanguinis]RBP68743.1 glyoxylase-like metal-dependent hydrolase (beta-lactamase superfamily II) [Brevibacterium celere]
MATVTVLSFDPARVNCAIITGRSRTLIVDAGPGPRSARTLAARAAELSVAATGRRTPVDVVTTHDHWDHFFGNRTLRDEGAETVWASPAFAADQEATAWIALDALRRDPEHAGFAADLPANPSDLVVEVTPVPDGGLDLGGSRAEFHVLGGHSTSDVVVRLPDEGIVLTGDLVEEGDPPQAGGDAALAEWARSLDALLSFPEARVFVPGHGVPVDRGFVERQRDDLDGFRRMGADAEVALPARSMPGEHDRSVPRESALTRES